MEGWRWVEVDGDGVLNGLGFSMGCRNLCMGVFDTCQFDFLFVGLLVDVFLCL